MNNYVWYGKVYMRSRAASFILGCELEIVLKQMWTKIKFVQKCVFFLLMDFQDKEHDEKNKKSMYFFTFIDLKKKKFPDLHIFSFSFLPHFTATDSLELKRVTRLYAPQTQRVTRPCDMGRAAYPPARKNRSSDRGLKGYW